MARRVSLHDGPHRCLGLVLSLGMMVLGCTGQTLTSNSARASSFEHDLVRSDPDPEPEVEVELVARPPFADDQRADGMFAYTDPGALPQLRVSGESELLPLEHTAVNARARGHFAEVRVAQRFVNNRKTPIEVTYTFPLPENAAVDDLRMIIGARTIESAVQTRARARDTYESAREAGHTAALLEQERPNVFTQSVANIAPGETIAVEIRYLQTLTQDGGMREFVFPMVVGPRYIPKHVGDAARITPPILGKGQRSGHDVSLSIEVDAGRSIDQWTAPTHTVVGAATKQGFSLQLADAETIPNRDFVLRWQVASAKPQASLLLGPKDEDDRGHFALVIQPPQIDLDEVVGRREMIFVIDVSGSMYGIPLALAKQTLREALPRMRPVDTFDIVSFAGGADRLFGLPQPANQHNLVLAERFIDSMAAGGSTQMLDAVDAALRPPLYDQAVRYVFFLTDGYIGNETEIFTAASELVGRAEQAGGRARVFGLGIGSSPNRELIAGLSRAGDGAPLYLSNREHPRAVVEDYYSWVDHPVLEDLRVDWGGLEVDSVYPREAPDLFASHAVVLHGRYEGKVKRKVEIHARVPGQRDEVELAVDISTSKVGDRILPTLWAREKISDLTMATWDGAMDLTSVERSITKVGLDYHLVTAYTSLVAVDDSRVIGDGDPLAVVQPVFAPEDVDTYMAGRDAGANPSANYKPMYRFEKKARELADLEKKQEEDRRKQLLELEKRAAAPGATFVELSRSPGVHEGELEQLLGEHRDALTSCFANQPSGWTLHFEVQVTERGKLEALKQVSAKPPSGRADDPEHEQVQACVDRNLRTIEWSRLDPGRTIVVEFEIEYP